MHTSIVQRDGDGVADHGWRCRHGDSGRGTRRGDSLVRASAGSQRDVGALRCARSVMDAAALRMAAVEDGWSPNAGLCVGSGFLALRAVADLFGIEYEPDPGVDHPISVTRDEFNVACRQLANDDQTPTETRSQNCNTLNMHWLSMACHNVCDRGVDLRI